jgi:hypothetical protein
MKEPSESYSTIEIFFVLFCSCFDQLRIQMRIKEQMGSIATKFNWAGLMRLSIAAKD